MGEYIEPNIWEDTPMQDCPAWTPRRRLSIVTVGAGFSALILAHKLQHQHPEFQDLVHHTIYECRSQIGGTWLVNRYPGVQCDVPAHIYAFPFDPKPDWSHFYAKGPEIHEYMLETTKKWNLDRDVKLGHKVLESTWVADLGQWKITVEANGSTFVRYADVLISAQGVLK
jgi:cation diffusion facilitator CzcD-associated flavoprotein CzcO